MWVLRTRDGIEGIGEAAGDWPGMFKELNLGTTATLTLLRGIFWEKQQLFFLPYNKTEWRTILWVNLCGKDVGQCPLWEKKSWEQK